LHKIAYNHPYGISCERLSSPINIETANWLTRLYNANSLWIAPLCYNHTS